MKKIALISAVLTILLSSTSHALIIEFKNTTQRTIIYNFFWIDNPYIGDKMPMAGGELQPGASNTIEDNYVPGEYSIYWFHRDEAGVIFTEFEIDPLDGKIILTPGEIKKLPSI